MDIESAARDNYITVSLLSEMPEEKGQKIDFKALVLQRQFREGCLGRGLGPRGVWRETDWLARCILASASATAATP